MSKAVRKLEPIAPDALSRRASTSAKKQKLSVLLVTGDDALWPQIGADLDRDLLLKQVDSIDELMSVTSAGQAAIVLWDARGHNDPAAVLSRLNLHSARFAVLALDDAGSAGAWTVPLQHRQIVAHVRFPILGEALAAAIGNAREETLARSALLGPATAAGGRPRFPKKYLMVAATALVVVIVGVGLLLTRRDEDHLQAARPAVPTMPAVPIELSPQPAPAAAPIDTQSAADEQVDAALEKARQAMAERHFIDPPAGSALLSYREALGFDPQNGEAQQGLQRLAEILISRVQSSLDDRKFDVALQSLETARSIDPNEPRLAALDERIASLRAELGPTQILAAMSALNFDRAAQLIDDAARAKSLSPAKLAALRDEVHRRRDEFDVSRLSKLIDARLQQDHLIEPRTDSAAYYLDQARQAGASVASLQAQMQELQRKLPLAITAAIDQRHYADADRLLSAMRSVGLPSAVIAGFQHDLNAAKAQPPMAKSAQPQLLELAQLRIGQGKLLEPANDCALYYVRQMQGAEPGNPGLAQITSALQTQIIDRARAALDGGDRDKAESLLQTAGALGASSDVDAFNTKLYQSAASPSGVPLVTEQALTRLNKLEVQYPPAALKAGTEGWVEMGFQIGIDGSVSNVHVLNSSPARAFDGAALKAVRSMRYQPVLQGGKLIAVATQLRVVFRLPK